MRPSEFIPHLLGLTTIADSGAHICSADDRLRRRRLVHRPVLVGNWLGKPCCLFLRRFCCERCGASLRRTPLGSHRSGDVSRTGVATCAARNICIDVRSRTWLAFASSWAVRCRVRHSRGQHPHHPGRGCRSATPGGAMADAVGYTAMFVLAAVSLIASLAIFLLGRKYA